MNAKPLLEEWRDIPGYEGAYQASTLGNVRSLNRIVRNVGGTREHKGRVLKPSKHPNGYLSVALCLGGKRTSKFVHALVIQAFLGVPSEGLQTCHNDGNPANNNLSNLRFDTIQANHQDKRAHGTLLRGADVGGAKLTAAAVLAMRRRRAFGESLHQIAPAYGISVANASRVCRGELWAHISGPITKTTSKRYSHAPA